MSIFKILIVLLAVTLTLSSGVFAADADATQRATFDRLIHAIQANDRDAFLKDASEEVKKGITPDVLSSVSHNMAPHLAKGFDSAYLTRLNQKGCTVDLWKLTFKDGSDDSAIRVVTQDGKLVGFFIE